MEGNAILLFLLAKENPKTQARRRRTEPASSLANDLLTNSSKKTTRPKVSPRLLPLSALGFSEAGMKLVWFDFRITVA